MWRRALSVSFDAASPALTGVTNLQKLPIPLSYGALTIEDYQITVGLSVVGQLLLAVTTVEERHEPQPHLRRAAGVPGAGRAHRRWPCRD
jgi:hypothetical protein